MIMTKDELFNPILGKEHDIVELFVEFFGEKYRDKIETNAKNTEVFFLENNPVESIQQLYTDHIDDNIADFYKVLGFQPGAVPLPTQLDDLKKAIKSRSFNEDMNLDMSIAAFISGVEGKPFEGRLSTYFLNPIHYIKVIKKIDRAIDLWNREYADKHKAIFEEGERLYEPLEEADREIESMVAEYDGKINGLHFAQARKILMANGELPFIRDMICANGLKQMIYLGRDNLTDPFLISDDQKESIVQLMQLLGYDKGSDYDAYIQDSSILDAIFDKKLIRELDTLEKEKLVKSIVMKQQFKVAESRIKKLNYADGDRSLMESIISYMSSSTAGGFNQCHFGKDGSLKSVCVCPMGATLDDEILLHELGHAYSSGIVHRSGNVFKVKTGIETLEYKCEYDKYSMQKTLQDGGVYRGDSAVRELSQKNRKYRILSEVIHDVLTKKLVELAHSKGLHFGKNDGVGRFTIYSFAGEMVEDFVERNLDFIKDCFMSDDPNMFIRAIGEHNAEMLASAVEKVVCIPKQKRDMILSEMGDMKDTFSKSYLAHMDCWSPDTKNYLSQFLIADTVFKEVRATKSM